MAAKKKSAKKKASKKTVAKKKSSPKPKKVTRKKAAKKTKPAAKKKFSKAKLASKKVPAAKKIAKKRAAPKKRKAIGIAPKGPSIEFAPEGIPITIEAVFEIAGNVTVKHLRGSNLLASKDIPQTGSITFPNAQPFDGITITGVCAGPAKITTDRVTRPLSDEQHPRNFPEGPIGDILSVRS